MRPRRVPRGGGRVVRGARSARPHRGASSTPSCTATAATPRSSPGSPSSGSSPWTSSRSARPRSVESGEGASFHAEPAGPQSYLTWMDNLKDWCISRQAAGGATASRSSHCVRTAAGRTRSWRTRACSPQVRRPPRAPGRERAGHLVRAPSSWTFATQGWPERH